MACPARALEFCPGEDAGRAGGDPSRLPTTAQVAPARRTICHARENSDAVPIVCSGWAAAFTTLPDGRKQILSFLLPGDAVSLAYLFEPMYGRTIEAVTDVTYRTFKRSDIKAKVFQNPRSFEMLSQLWMEERRQAEESMLDLGRRTASGRLARCILALAQKLEKRGMMPGRTMAFPLRQHHLADASGLTPVHVCKVLGEFQRDGLIGIDGRTLTLIDAAALRRAADLI